MQINDSGRSARKSPYIRFWMLDGDSGDEYKVSQRADGSFACACKRWIFSKIPAGATHKPDCKHIIFLKQQLNLERHATGVITPTTIHHPTVTVAPVNTFTPPPEAIARPVLDRPVRRFRFVE